MEQTINEIAKYVFGFDIKPRNSDGYDFFDSDRGSIGVKGLERALQLAYEAGAAAASVDVAAADKKAFFFCMTVCSQRTGTPIGKRCGVVFAATEDEAEHIAWDRYGDDNSCKLWVHEVAHTYGFTVYKGEI